MKLESCLEAVLFAAAKPLTVKRLADFLSVAAEDIEVALTLLSEQLSARHSGLQLIRHGSEVELVTSSAYAEQVKKVVQDEVSGELSRPSLEALAILAYRGPMTRPELEQIRGVQSSLILRNLMLRGLVEVTEDARLGQPLYRVTIDFLRYIGVDGVESLPEYPVLHSHAGVEDALRELEARDASV